MSSKIINEIEEHICNLWLLNESSTNALAKKQTLANHKLTLIQRQTRDILKQLDELGFCIAEYLIAMIALTGFVIFLYGLFAY